jgi:DNA primase
MRIPESTLAEIRGKLDIAEVVGEHVTLQRRGARFWGLCPFHQEKSPSFTVTPDKGVFYCFGCHKGGTVFDFVMEVEKVPWRDAVELLAKKAGVEIPREEEEPGGIRRDAFLELYKRVAGSFHWLLTEGPQAEAARRYLELRGVTTATIDSFGLGYAPPERDWLFRFLSQKSYTEDFLSRTGLFMESRQNAPLRVAGSDTGIEAPRQRALFADRLMFPIANARGEIIAFGGRILGDGQPKYLNSPETPYFRKGENLFGLDKAAAAIRQAGQFILVEGYMDVLAMHQAGFTACVAPLGTALTEAQVRLLRRYAKRCVVLFDGDDAGQKATARAIEMLERQDLIVLVVALPGGRDPADFVQAGESAALAALLEKPSDSFPYLLEGALAAHDVHRAEGREAVRDALFPYVAAPASQLRRDGYLTSLADALDADPAAVRRDFASWLRRQRPGFPSAERQAGGAVTAGAAPQGTAATTGPRNVASGEPPGALSAELFVMLAVAANRGLFSVVRNAGIGLDDLEDESARALFVALEEAYRAEEPGFEAVCARIEDPGLRELAIRKVASGEFDLNQERLVSDGVRRIRQRVLAKKRDVLAAEMRKAERERPDPARMRDLLAEKMHLDDELERLKARAAGV